MATGDRTGEHDVAVIDNRFRRREVRRKARVVALHVLGAELAGLDEGTVEAGHNGVIGTEVGARRDTEPAPTDEELRARRQLTQEFAVELDDVGEIDHVRLHHLDLHGGQQTNVERLRQRELILREPGTLRRRGIGNDLMPLPTQPCEFAHQHMAAGKSVVEERVDMGGEGR